MTPPASSRASVAALLALLLAGAISAQSTTPAKGPFDGLVFRDIGPASAAGRIDDVAVYEPNPNVFYVATATGGLWKTTNQGTTFDTVFDNEDTSSIGDVAIAPTDPNLVWVGTGENNNRQSSSWGTGVFKSTDGGRSWTKMGLTASKHIARILVDPIDSNIVLVAALGSLWGAGGDRGVYRTTDGGRSWERTLAIDDDTGATELVMDPANNKVIYAATYQRRRHAGGFNGGGEGSGIHKSTDGGITWTKLTGGIPAGPKGRIGLDVYRRNPNVLYARIEHATESGVYRSDDAGHSWRKLSSVNPRPMYFSQIRIDPTDDSRIYVLGVQLHVSDDGGRTFRSDGAEKIHVDFHAMWINPADPNHVILGGDGGVGISYDRSRTYVWLNNMPLGQFYHVSYDMRSPYTVCGGLQDNNTWCGPSAVRNQDGIANDDWFVISGGDGFVALVDPDDPDIMYAESQDGRMNRVDRATNERKSIRPEPPAGEAAYRWNWDTPMLISPHDRATLFVAANRLFRSPNRGDSWTLVSEDLTTNVDRDEIEVMGVLGKDIKIARNDGVGAYPSVVAFNESVAEAGVYWTGSDDGLVHVSRDAGKTWSNVTGRTAGGPKGLYVAGVAPSRFVGARAYVAFEGHRSSDFGTYLYGTDDYGQSWTSLVSGPLQGQVIRTVTEDLKNQDVLYAGTEQGLFVSVDRGRSWTRVKANLPTVPIYEISLHPRDNDMILATHGRSVWILDDLSPFQQAARARGARAFLYDVAPPVERRPSNDRMRNFEGNRLYLGRNPAYGATLQYRLEADATQVAVIVTDGSGQTVRELRGDDTKDRNKAGINTVTWDLRHEPIPPVRGQEGGGGGFFGNAALGPTALPGAYRVTLRVDDADAVSAEVVVKGDPDVTLSDEDRRTHFDTAMALHQLLRTATEAATATVDAYEQLTGVQEALKNTSDADARSALEATMKKLDASRRALGVAGGGFGGGGGFGDENVRGAISRVKGAVLGSTSRPTEVQLRQTGELRARLSKVVAELNATLEGLPAFYRTLAEKGLFPAMPKPVKPLG